MCFYASRFLFVLLICGIVSGCAATTRTKTNRANDYNGQPKRLFVITDIGTDFGSQFSNAFQNKIKSIAKDCGVVVDIAYLSVLELDESRYDRQMMGFRPDTVLSIKRNGGTKSAEGVLFHVIYDSKLIDMSTKKLVWRAQTDFYRGGFAIPVEERGESLAIDLTNKIKEDKIFRSCPLVVEKK